MNHCQDENEHKSRVTRYFCYFVPGFLGVALFVSDCGVIPDAVGLTCAAYCFYQMNRAMPLSYMLGSLKRMFF
jgi:hypothetical protein